MADMFRLTIPGEPFGKPRPKFGNGRTYRTQEDLEYEKRVVAAWQMAGGPTISAEHIGVMVDAWNTLPKSRPKRVASEPYNVKPDADNIAKAVTDPLNGRAWGDDSSVTLLTVVKHDRTRDAVPRVDVTVYDAGQETKIGDDANC